MDPLAVEAVYDRLTEGCSRFLRAAELVYLAAEANPGLLPTRAEIDTEREHPQRDKQGLEIVQGQFLGLVLAHPRQGPHLQQAMMRPRAESAGLLEGFRRSGSVDLGPVRLERRGPVGLISFQNLEFLNSEDDSSVSALETAVDLVLLDDEIQVGVLRGDAMRHPKYAGRRVFSSGINLTHLYYGKISYVEFMIERELGALAKMYRGLGPSEFRLGDVEDGLEKPFMAAVEAFAIGGGCQILLVMDRVIAERGSYFSLPARKEGIIPGSANLRLPRLVGDRLARQAIFFNLVFPADTAEGRLIADEVVPGAEMDAAIERNASEILDAGMDSLVSNRRAMRLGAEPLSAHRLYMAAYSRDQARCMYSPALIHNLEQNWQAKSRRL